VHNLAVKPGQTLRVRMTGTGDADLYVRWNASRPHHLHLPPLPRGHRRAVRAGRPADAKTAYIAVNGYAASSKYSVTT
jgi:hypothetical protein